ncbi:HNH endonuclease [Nocardia gipuzkoensis]
MDKSTVRNPARPKELITRLLRGHCELCNRTDGVVVHHVRGLAELADRSQPHPEWVTVMLKKRRKTLVVCRDCHTDIHETG